MGYLVDNTNRQTATSMSTSQTSTLTFEKSSTTSTAISTVSSSGLELRIDLNTTAMEPGQTLTAIVSLRNTLNDSLSLPLAPGDLGGGSISSWENYDFICGNGGFASYLVGFAVLEGRFSGDNLSQAPAPLQVAAQADLPCAYMVLSHGVTINFSPGSDNAYIPGTDLSQQPIALNITTYACIAVSAEGLCRSGTGLYGYWSTSGAICCPASSNAADLFRFFTPGDYTIVAEDVWDQEVFAHFRVVPATSLAGAVSAQESPFSAANSPIVALTVADFSSLPIVSLNASLTFEPPSENPGGIPITYPYTFMVNSSIPLEPGQAVQETRTLNGPLFDLGVEYPLTIAGTLSNGKTFTYTEQVHFTNSVPSW